MDIRYANHPEDSKHYDTNRLRENYLKEEIFLKDEICLAYSHTDRIIFGGAMPIKNELELSAGKEMGVSYFLERRELGVINIGGSGEICIDDKVYNMNKSDGIYVGMGAKKIIFKSDDEKNPAKFYINSTPAHKTYDTVKINIENVTPIRLGANETLNKRSIYQYIHPNICKSCQLLMGMTILEPNNVWNTMPCHTHERRMEVYFYFDLDCGQRVVHFMGEPSETRHIFVSNEQALISPSWSIHSGVGTSNYTFIWGMCGENQTFDDMDHIDMKELR